MSARLANFIRLTLGVVLALVFALRQEDLSVTWLALILALVGLDRLITIIASVIDHEKDRDNGT